MASSGSRTSTQQQQYKGGVLSEDSDRHGLWGFLIGIIVAAFIAVPLASAVAFATHPATQALFGVHLKNASPGGYAAFWWLVALFLAALPFLIGFGVAKLSTRTLGIIAGIVVIFIIAFLVLGQLFLL
jgi:amino acid transporter